MKNVSSLLHSFHESTSCQLKIERRFGHTDVNDNTNQWGGQFSDFAVETGTQGDAKSFD